MNPTIFLTAEEQSLYKDINPYAQLKETAAVDLFARASYPYFNYYSTKVKIETVSDTAPLHELPEHLSNGEVCISFANSELTSFLLNKFKNKGNTLYYIDKNVATKDTERTWKILENLIDFKKINKVYFIYPHFTKIVHAYRIATIYGKEVIDITY